MTEQDYLWDGAGAPTAELAALEQGLAPLAEEAEALLDAIDFAALAEDGEDGEDGVVVQLPMAVSSERPSARAAGGLASDADVDTDTAAKPAGGGWWMAAAAAVLLGLSAVALSSAHQRKATAVAAGATGASASRVTIVVTEVDSARAAERGHVLAGLRPKHHAIAACVAPIRAPRIVEVRMLSVAGRVELERLAERGPSLSADQRACLGAQLSSWDAAALGDGVIDLELHLDP